MTNVKVQRKTVVSQKEALGMLMIAHKLYDDRYYRARNKALLGLLYKTGKRRSEVAALEMDDIEVKAPFLSVTFTVVKKRKTNVMTRRRETLLPLNDVFVQALLDYYRLMRKEHPQCRYLFPSVINVFGKSVVIRGNKHLSGRQVLRVIKELNPRAWCHLFRETMGAQVVRSDPSIMAPFKVMNRLDLESFQTAFNYMRRYAADVIGERGEGDLDVIE